MVCKLYYVFFASFVLSSIISEIHVKIKANNTIEGYSKVLDKRISIEEAICIKLVYGKNLTKWINSNIDTYVIYPYLNKDGDSSLINEDLLVQEYPLLYEYFLSLKTRLSNRGTAKMKYEYWYSHWNKRKISRFLKRKIITPDICLGTKMSLDSNSLAHNDTAYAFIPQKDYENHIYYLLGILNSKLVWFFLKETGNVVRGGYFRFKTKYLDPFKLPIIPNSVENEPIHNLTNNIIQLKEENPKADTTELEQEIDVLVYQLYNLTYEEVLIVDPAFHLSKDAYEVLS